MKSIHAFSLLILLMANIRCSEPAEKPSTLVVKKIDLAGAKAFFSVSENNLLSWYVIDKDGKPQPLNIDMEGHFTDADAKSFDLRSIPHSSYYYFSSQKLGKGYIVDTIDGFAYQYQNRPQACFGDEFVWSDGTSIVIAPNHLSEGYNPSYFPRELVHDIMVDKEKMISYFGSDNNLYGYTGFGMSDYNLLTLPPRIVASWMDNDGYRYAMNSQGDVYKLSNYAATLQGSIEREVLYPQVLKIPAVTKTYAAIIDSVNTELQLSDLHSPYTTTTFTLPSSGDVPWHYITHGQSTIFIFSTSNQTQTLTTIDAVTLNVKAVPIKKVIDKTFIAVIDDDLVLVFEGNTTSQLHDDGSVTPYFPQKINQPILAE